MEDYLVKLKDTAVVMPRLDLGSVNPSVAPSPAFPAVELDFLSSKFLGSFQAEGAQWLSGRVLDSRPRDRGLEPHRHRCIVVLEQDTFS